MELITYFGQVVLKKRRRFKKKIPGELTTDERSVDEKKLFEVDVY